MKTVRTISSTLISFAESKTIDVARLDITNLDASNELVEPLISNLVIFNKFVKYFYEVC